MRKSLKPKDIRKIVIFRTDRIGEVLLATPVIEALTRRFPQAKISFITSPYARDIVSDRSDLNEVIIFDTINRKVSLPEAVALSLNLRKRRFDLAVILNAHKMLHLAAFLAGIPHRVGFDRKWGILLNYRMRDTRSEGRMHEIKYNLKLLEAVGIEEEDIPPSISVLSQDSDYAKGLFTQHNIAKDRKTVIIHPGTSNPAKQWPLESFIELIRKLGASGNMNIIVVGDENEKALCERVVSAAGPNHFFNFAGLFTLKQLAALFKIADLLITNDNGPMHIAAAVGTKVIAIFGRNIPGVSPVRWGPYGEGHIVFHKDPGCSPCYDRHCPYDFKCLKSITPEEVWGRVPGGRV